MKSLKDINYDKYTNPQEELNLYEYKKKIRKEMTTIDLDRSANEILTSLKYNVMGANLPTNSSRSINTLLAKQDLSFLEFVNDKLVNEIYPEHKEHYVLPIEREDRSIVYEDCKVQNDEAILYTEVLDEEFLYLNTCINVMKKNHGSFDKYIDTFSKGFTSGLYKVVYDLLDYTDKNPDYSEVLSFIDISNNLLRYSLDELTCLMAYAQAKINLIELHIGLGFNEDNYSKYLDAQDTIAEAYCTKKGENYSKRTRKNK